MKKHRIITFGFLAVICLHINAQEQIVENYIHEGIQSNLALQQIQADYAKSIQSLRSARGLFYPDLSLNARYTVARGGRTIEFPVGDMLNPVYATLNELQDNIVFPNLENQEFEFYRPNEHETKLSLTQPVYSPKVIYNYQIKKQQTHIETANLSIYKRELIKEIKSAYYGYLMTVYLLKLVDETTGLLKENLRVSKSLYENDKVTQDVVYRSEAELQNVYLVKASAEKEHQAARSYFNFLLNKSLNSEIKIPEGEEIPEIHLTGDIDQKISGGLSAREEINKLQSYSAINEKFTKLARSANYPNLFLAIDYGFQGEEYSFSDKDDFLLASVVLRWNLFQGLKNRADIQHAKIACEQINLRQQELEKQIELQIINAYYNLNAAREAINVASIQVTAAEKAYQVIEEKYRIGQARLIEYTDARTAMTRSKQNLIIAVFEYKTKEAELERVTADRQLD
jgi:outer membrane protein